VVAATGYILANVALSKHLMPFLMKLLVYFNADVFNVRERRLNGFRRATERVIWFSFGHEPHVCAE
jgi:hypothetical protein